MWRHQIFFFAFQHFHDNISVLEHDEKPSHTKFDMNWFMVARDMAAWIPKMSPIEISVNWPGLVHNCLEPDQFTLISMGLIRYSCGHISGPHEPIPTQIGLWMFFIMLHWYMVSKTLKSKKSFLWRHRFCTLFMKEILSTGYQTTKF